MTRRSAVWSVVGAVVVAAALRLLLGEGSLVDVDADLHLLRARGVLDHGLSALRGVHPALAWPDGAHVPWPAGFDLLLAAVGAREWWAALLMPILGAASVPVAYVLARRLVERRGAVAVALAVALLPGHIELTRIGRVDHAAIEPLLLWGALAALLAGRQVLAGVAAALLLFTSPAGPVGAALFAAAAIWLGSARALAVAAVGAAVGALVGGTALQWLPRELSGLHVLALAAAVLATRWRWSAIAYALAGVVAGSLVTVRLGTFGRGLFVFGVWPAAMPLTAIAFALPLALVVSWRERERSPERILVGGTALVLLGLALVQRRYLAVATAPVAIVIVDAVSAIEWRRATAAVAILCGLVGCPPSLDYLTTQPLTGAREQRNEAVRSLALVLARRPPGPVLSQWPVSYVLARWSGHPAFASPVAPERTETATRLLLGDDPVAAVAALDRAGIRYVVTTPLSASVTERYLAALHDGRAPEIVQHRSLLARLHNRDGDGVPGWREIAATPNGHAKLFERVPGVRLRGTAPAGSPVVATVEMLSSEQSEESRGIRSFRVNARARADAAGHFELALPYATEPGLPVFANGPWRLVRAGRPLEQVTVRDGDVRTGAALEVD